MPATLQIKFSHSFPGTIWNTLALPKSDILIIEVRDDKNFQVQFAALDLHRNTFLWKGLQLKETWWIGLTAANEDTLLFHTYIDKGNPDHKNLIAFDIINQRIRWEIGEFSFFDWNDTEIWGYRTKDELIQATIQIESGELSEKNWPDKEVNEVRSATRPACYVEGTSHFQTVEKFIQQKTRFKPVKGMEYLEWNELIIVSLYVEESGLANYLFVFDQEGKVMLEVKLGEKLTGLGTDTFFMHAGCLFLVKNKSELVAYSV